MAKQTYNVEDRDGTGNSGTIEFDPDTKLIEINLDVPDKKKKEIQDFFTATRDFMVPESDRIDDFRIDSVTPVDDPGYFEMAMSELYGATGIYVLW